MIGKILFALHGDGFVKNFTLCEMLCLKMIGASENYFEA